MGIYKKLQNVRGKLAQTPLKKSGWNKFNNFKYFELGDFLPTVSKLCAEEGICSVIDFGNPEYATLTIYDDEDEKSISFVTPMKHLNTTSQAGKEKMNDLQALGAEQTYVRRYLYMNAFEVIDNDVVDAQDQQQPPQETPRDGLIRKMLSEQRQERKLTMADVLKVVKSFGAQSVGELSDKDFTAVIDRLNKVINPQDADTEKATKELKAPQEPPKDEYLELPPIEDFDGSAF